MGVRQSTFSEEQLEKYQDCTFFTRKEVLTAFLKFCNMKNISSTAAMKTTYDIAMSWKVGFDELRRSDALGQNPFAKRICLAFSSDGVLQLTFNEYLNMMSVLSDRAPAELKAAYAFKIYDYDDDSFIEKADLRNAMRDLLRGIDDNLTTRQVEAVVSEIIKEADLDNDGKLSYMEFEHAILKSPSFLQNFHVRL